MPDVYKTSLGVKIEITMDIDLSGNDGVTLTVKKPDNSTVEWTASIDDATGGVVSYTSEANELDILGEYIVQPKVTFTGKVYFGTPVKFTVLDIVT